MGFFTPKSITCDICGDNSTKKKLNISDGKICLNCFVAGGFKPTDIYHHLTISEMKEKTAHVEIYKERLKILKPSKLVSPYIEFDSERKFVHFPIDKIIYSFDDIVDVELLEDGNPITKGGLGSAVAGGLLFGEFGAIVGGVTGSKKKVVEKLDIKITLNNITNPTIYLHLIKDKTKANSGLYKQAYNNAQEILSAFTVIFKEREQSKSNSSIEQSDVSMDIRKFKQLLDEGIITNDEFEQKKKQLLCL